MGFAAIALVAMLAVDPRAVGPDEIISEVTERDVIAAAVSLGWKIGGADRTIDGGFHRTLILPTGEPATVAGLECEGQPLRCSGYYMSINFGLGNPKRAELAKKELKYLYAQLNVRDPSTFEISRAEFLNGGITRKHLEISLETFGIIAADAAKKVFPCGAPVGGREPNCEKSKEFTH